MLGKKRVAVKRPIRILYMIDHIDGPGGTERHLSYLVKMLDRKRFKSSVMIFNLIPNDLVDDMVEDSTEVFNVRVARYYTLNALIKASEIYRIIKKHRFDIVQTFHYKSDIYGATIARMAGVKHIISSKRDSADFKSPFNLFLHRLVGPITDQYIIVSEEVGKVIKVKEKVPSVKMHTIYNGVDTQEFFLPSVEQKRLAKESLGISSDDFVIGIVAWMRPEKDHSLLFNAMRRILKSGTQDTKLVVVGGGPMKDNYKAMIRSSNLLDNVLFFEETDDVSPYLHAFDIACLVPKSNEGFSNAVLEKMAKGLPLIVTDVGGNKEAVEHGINGFVIKPGDLDNLVRYILILYKNNDLRIKMGLRSRKSVENKFELFKMIKAHEHLYQSMLDKDI